MPRTLLLALALALALALVPAARDGLAQTSYPMVMALHPAAARAGETSEHVVHSRYTMHGAFQVLITGDGVSGEIATEFDPPDEGQPPPNLQAISVRFAVEPDAAPGVRDFRIVAPNGASTIGQLVVVRDPVVVETENDGTPETAQEVPIPAAVCGRIEKAEDVDLYKFRIDAPTNLTFHVRSMRLQDKIHDLQTHADPIITLRAASGATLAVADNHFAADPVLSHRFDAPGEYLLEVRDVRYQGNQYWTYCLEITDRPFLETAFPLGVPRGEAAEVRPIGFHVPDDAAAALGLASEFPLGIQEVLLPLAQRADGTAPEPVALYVTDLPLVTETEDDNDSPAAAQPIPVPAGVNGLIERPDDVDYYAFEAKQGEQVSVEVVARRLQSRLDSILRILDADGRPLAENDDLRIGKRTVQDSWIEAWTAPADGTYLIEVRDLHLRGGAAFPYFLKVTRPEPYFELWLDTDKTQLTPGTSAVLFARAVRKNGFASEIALAIDGLPDGVTASCGRILENGQDGCIILTAAEDVPLAAANVTVTGRAPHETGDGPPRELAAVAEPQQEIYMPGGGRNHWTVELHTVAVGAPADLRAVRLDVYEIALAPGESRTIEVDLERAPGFDGNVTLDVLFQHLGGVFADTLPAGVTLDAQSSKTLLTANESKGHITLKAAADAPPAEAQQVSVMANISINFVMKATYSSRPLRITVTAP